MNDVRPQSFLSNLWGAHQYCNIALHSFSSELETYKRVCQIGTSLLLFKISLF